MNTVPDAQLILGYKEFFNVDPPSRRLDIIEGVCKESLIAEFAGLNHRLKPKVVNYFDTSLETQLKELRYFCRRDDLLRRYTQTIRLYNGREKHFPLIFTRQTCLFALEEIIRSDLPVIDNFRMGNAERWDSVFKYLLAVNTVITAMDDDHKDELINFETLNPKMLPLNEIWNLLKFHCRNPKFMPLFYNSLK